MYFTLENVFRYGHNQFLSLVGADFDYLLKGSSQGHESKQIYNLYI